jgi:preprotein translocase SecE subunit
MRGRGIVAYLRAVWDELRKVIWPTRPELWRMTWVVVATVIVFGLLIGGADFLFATVTRPLITGTPPTSSSSPAPTPTPSATASPSASSSATATPTP